MIEGLNGFMRQQPNENHQFLNLLMQKGATVVTPNFNDCIEKGAYCSLAEKGKSYGVISGIVGSSQIYYYHGLGSNTNEMGATIRRMKTGLPIEFQSYLRNCFDRKLQVQVGHPVVDSAPS